jgi:hypothetical protein
MWPLHLFIKFSENLKSYNFHSFLFYFLIKFFGIRFMVTENKENTNYILLFKYIYIYIY